MNKLALFLLSAALLSAQDFGGVLENTLSVDANAEGYSDTRDTLGLRLWTGYESNNLVFRLQGSLTYQYFNAAETNRLIPELDLLYAKFAFADMVGEDSQMVLAAGRLQATDPSGLLLNTLLDQLDLSLRTGAFRFRLGAGYNGLISKYTSDIGYTLMDTADQNLASRYLSSPRLLAWFWAGWAPDAANLLQIGYLRQQDFRQDVESSVTLPKAGDFTFDPSRSGLFHTNYVQLDYRLTLFQSGVNLGLSGVLSQGESLPYIAGDQYKTVPHLGYLVALNASWSTPDRSLLLALNGLYTSGDSNKRLQFDEGGTISELLEVLSTFKSASAPSFAQIFNPKPGNLALGRLRAVHRPWADSSDSFAKGFLYGASVVPFFRTNTGPISTANTNIVSDDYYLGTEVDLNLSWRPVSDFGLELNSGFFFPSTGTGGVFESVRTSMEHMTSLTLTLAF